ncbi:conserved hypothetical protein [Vibrio antiquarius]|uniref:Uncharacterized protein n=3 Tax=Vibrio antiquarius (strain Ex25) TaxID=150340 RepID=A0ACA6QLY3_VIBAE|nr:hypothetical protein VEA_003228 [Vibrio antiquarius]EDN58070.1 conserved hypothetical protein [Vibrio antiquarius]
MLKRIGLYLREICSIFIGFYLMAIILVYSLDTKQSFVSVLNSLGIFLSSIGVVVAILTVLQQHYLHQSKEINAAVNSSNNFMFKLSCMLEVYGCIKQNYLEQFDKQAGDIELLDGDISDWLVEVDLETNIFISELDSHVYVDSYYAIFNYNRYIEGIFRWQRNQKEHSDDENIIYLTERLNGLEEFGSSLIELQEKMHKLLRNNFPQHSFFNSSVTHDEFKNLAKITT